MFVLPTQRLTCVAPYQTDSGGADIRLPHPARPGSSLSEQMEAGHFTTEPIGQLSPIGGLEGFAWPAETYQD